MPVLRTQSMGATIVQAVVGLFVVISGTYDMSVQTTEAIPAFARKYALNCTTCHTAPPQLNTFGERFLSWHHDRFRTAAAQAHFSGELRPGFRLISYWKRLRLANGRRPR